MSKRNIIRLALVGIIAALVFFLFSTPFAPLLQQGFGVIMSGLTILWVVSLFIKDASIIDIYWGLGFVLVTWFYFYSLEPEYLTTRNYVLLTMVSVWGLRLFSYLAFRNIGHGEDYRYQEMRAEFGKNWWWWSFFQVFALQGAILWIVSSVLVPALFNTGGFTFFEILGMALWGIGFFFEAVGDEQLRRFKKDPNNKGKVMDKGLWKYTRHPNYFGDATLWWGFFCFALAHPQGVFFIFAPLFMTFLLMKVSGVAMLEVKLKKSKPKYQEYIRKTSAFFPRRPKN